ncbi:hypothetical protein QC762_121600 [Podospora pseudocomata]|uniref:Uncharacterized protein n=1 Tax=Podospora pseudocomata TaxID=2093779 RepID=A0ABR0GYP4_9PEZI|nr:hypothetical protein QC762_121600 [Podospora pseudocomata]
MDTCTPGDSKIGYACQLTPEAYFAKLRLGKGHAATAASWVRRHIDRVYDDYSSAHLARDEDGVKFNPAMLQFLRPIRRIMNMEDPDAPKQAYLVMTCLQNLWYDEMDQWCNTMCDKRLEDGLEDEEERENEPDSHSCYPNGGNGGVLPPGDNRKSNGKDLIGKYDHLLDKLVVGEAVAIHEQQDYVSHFIGITDWLPETRKELDLLSVLERRKKQLTLVEMGFVKLKPRKEEEKGCEN